LQKRYDESLQQRETLEFSKNELNDRVINLSDEIEKILSVPPPETKNKLI
jgi:hypothetical protein